jgi:aspartyl-tRNA(Asn)/glutamyl-tRNA(Gln) amidotransferase subunit A
MYQLSARQIQQLFLEKKVSAVEIVEYFLKRIHKEDGKIGSFLKVLDERALNKAKELDQKLKEGKPLGKLAGIPIAIKDNIHIKGEKTTCASKIMEHYTAPYDATVTQLIEAEDGIILGKNNLDEFAMGSTTENSAFFPCKNPWNLQLTPGGSSGGGAACVSARLCSISLGSDTGGSIRLPASFTGICGFKPTYGKVSRYGLVAFASSLDQIGPMATCVEDTALMAEVLSKHDHRDSTSLQDAAENYLDELKLSIQGKKIGVPFEFLESMSEERKAHFEENLAKFRELGCTIVPVKLPMSLHSIPVYYILAPAEASTNLARYDGIGFSERSKSAETLEELYEFSRRDGFGKEVKQRILLGTYVLSSGHQDAYYKKAQKVRKLIIEEFKEAFKECDMIAMPTSPGAAFPLQSIQDPVKMYLQDIYTIPANMAGLPAISVPTGFTDDKRPLSIQLVGPYKEDGRVLRFAYQLEQHLNLKSLIPPLYDHEV